MGRSGYTEDGEETWHFVMWRGAVASAIRGRRGQSFLKEMLTALDAIEARRLIKGELQDSYDDGAVCAIGAVGKARGVDMQALDPYDMDTIPGLFGIPGALAMEIAYLNDECGALRETPEARYSRMRDWIASKIRPAHTEAAGRS